MENHNQLRLTACIAAPPVVRQTPAGMPAVDVRLEHASEQGEAGAQRQVQLGIKAIAFGALAERLARQAPHSCWVFQGFLVTPRNSKTVVFHIQDMQQN